MTIGFDAPLPPARTGVADYAAALLGELRKFGPVEADPGRGDVALYQIGNNALHREIYERALDRPGVVVLHDAVLHHFLLGHLARDRYIEEFVYNYGEWNRGMAADLWNGRAGSGSDSRYFEFPMLRRIAESARAVVVHNPAAAAMAARHAPAARIIEIPHLYQDPPLPSEGEAIRYRQRLGAGSGTFLFGLFGFLRESKRVLNVLEAFAEVHQANPRTALLVAGDFVSSDLERAAEPCLVRPGVIRRPFLAESEFWLAAAAVDACINLRHPSAGETSGITVRLMGMGKPVLVSDSPEVSRFPEDACVRIATGAAERDSLVAHMVLLPSMTGVAGAIGQRGASHIRGHHRLDLAARRFWELLCGLGS